MHSTRACDASENEVRPDLCAALDLQLSQAECFAPSLLPLALSSDQTQPFLTVASSPFCLQCLISQPVCKPKLFHLFGQL